MRRNVSKLVLRGLFATAAVAITGVASAGGDTQGESVYAQHCVGCHQLQGAGMPSVAPPLKADAVKRLGDTAGTYVIEVLLNGAQGLDPAAFYAAPMPRWAHLSDAELSALANYILKLNGLAKPARPDVVSALRKTPAGMDRLQEIRGGK